MTDGAVLVTGGAGFIGSHVVESLLASGHEVRVLDDLSTGSEANIEGLDVHSIVGDVADFEVVKEAVAGTACVVHLAAARAVGLSIEDPIGSDRINTGGTVNILTAARDAGVEKVVFGSSSSVYGGTAPLPTQESAPLNPRSPYAVSKMAGEHYCRVFSELFGIKTTVLRLFNVFGPRQRPDSPYAAAIPLFIEAVLAGKPPVVFGDGKQTRDFTYVKDVAEAIVKAVETDTARHVVCNIAAGGRHSIIDLLETLSDIVGVGANPRFEGERPGDVRDSQADISKAAEVLGWRPKTSFRDGLEATVAWIRAYTKNR
jgi:UDP-glucose 4-epimerase